VGTTIHLLLESSLSGKIRVDCSISGLRTPVQDQSRRQTHLVFHKFHEFCRAVWNNQKLGSAMVSPPLVRFSELIVALGQFLVKQFVRFSEKSFFLRFFVLRFLNAYVIFRINNRPRK